MSGQEAATPRRQRLLEVTAFGLAWLPYAWLAHRFWFVTDDAFISFRYARNWALGHGLRYNLGESPPVEGYSDFLWVALCAGIARLGGPVEVWAPRVGFLAGTVLLVLVWSVLRRSLPLVVTTLATLTLSAFPPFGF